MKRSHLYQILVALTLALPSLPGCETLPVCPEATKPACPEIPACSRNRVYVFLISGIDPLCCMDDLRDRLIDHGFIKVYSGPRPYCHHYAKEIQRLHQDDEHAKFVIVSQGSAAGAARET